MCAVLLDARCHTCRVPATETGTAKGLLRWQHHSSSPNCGENPQQHVYKQCTRYVPMLLYPTHTVAAAALLHVLHTGF